MAVIIPYGDTNAHGSIGDSITFRRRFGRVVMQAKPVPKKSRTPAQIVQRDAFKQASYDWYSYDSLSKEYFDIRGRELGMTGKNLFISAKLKNIMPSQTPLSCVQVQQAQIVSLIEPTPTPARLIFGGYLPGPGYVAGGGFIYDNENVFNTHSVWPQACSYFQITTDQYTNDLFRYGVWLQVLLDGGGTLDFIVRFKTVLPQSTRVYISDDGSSFSDSAFTHLVATNNF